MELRHLRYFVAVAEEQNVTRAATRLHVSQPPLSRQIRDLEEEMGVQLFERSPQSLRLTEAGRVFLPEARGVLQRAEEAVQTARAVAANQTGEVQVGFAPSLTVDFLPAALRRFRQQRQELRIVLHDFATEEMLAALRDRRLHLALLVRPTAAMLRGLTFEELRRYEPAVAFAPRHPLCRTRRFTVERIAREPLAVYTRSDYPEYHRWLAALFQPARRMPVFESEHDSASSLATTVSAGGCVAVVQAGFEHFAGPRLLVHPLTAAQPKLAVGVVWRPGAGRAAMEFVEAIRAAARATGQP